MSTQEGTKNRGSICNLTQVHPCGLMHLLVHMRYVGRMPTKICRTTMLNLYKNYKKKTVRKRRVWWGLVADRPPIFFVLSKVDIFSGLFLEMVISQDNYKVRQREFKYAIQTFPATRLRKMFQSSGTCPSVLNVT